MLPPEEIVAQVRLNPLGLALYRLDRDREILVSEALRLVEIGWAEPDVVRLQPPNQVPTIFVCIILTLEGALELAELDQAIGSVEGRWGERKEINVFVRDVFGDHQKQAARRAQPMVFSRRSFRYQEDIDGRSRRSARNWYPGGVEGRPVEDLWLPSYYDKAAPLNQLLTSDTEGGLARQSGLSRRDAPK